jgi:hypothetical protein
MGVEVLLINFSPPIHPSSMTNQLFVYITFAQLPLHLSNHPSKLMYDLLVGDIAFTQFPSPSTVSPSTQTYVLNSPSLRSLFFFFSFYFDIIISIL